MHAHPGHHPGIMIKHAVTQVHVHTHNKFYKVNETIGVRNTQGLEMLVTQEIMRVMVTLYVKQVVLGVMMIVIPHNVLI